MPFPIWLLKTVPKCPQHPWVWLWVFRIFPTGPNHIYMEDPKYDCNCNCLSKSVNIEDLASTWSSRWWTRLSELSGRWPRYLELSMMNKALGALDDEQSCVINSATDVKLVMHDEKWKRTFAEHEQKKEEIKRNRFWQTLTLIYPRLREILATKQVMCVSASMHTCIRA